MIEVGKGLFAEDSEEAVWFEQSEETKEFIKQCEGSIKRAEADLKLSTREVHQKFIKGARENIRVRKLDIKIKKQFLEFCNSKINPAKQKI